MKVPCPPGNPRHKLLKGQAAFTRSDGCVLCWRCPVSTPKETWKLPSASLVTHVRLEGTWTALTSPLPSRAALGLSLGPPFAGKGEAWEPFP